MEDYIILEEKSAKLLAEVVNSHKKMGYSPTGGVCIGEADGMITKKNVYLQAMVKE